MGATNMKQGLWRIGISGSHCSGKSSLSTALTEALRSEGTNVACLPEPIDTLRPLIRQQQPPLSSEHVYYLLLGQHLGRLEESSNEYLVYDRTLLDYAAYFKTEGHKNIPLKNAIDQLLPWYLSHFDFLFFLPVEIPLELDGKRPSSEKHRTDVEDAMLKIANDFNIELIELRGSIEERTDQALRKIESVTRGNVH